MEAPTSTIGNLKTKVRIKRLALILSLCVVGLTIMNIDLREKYRKQGGRLSHRIINVLIADGYCHDAQDCKGIVLGEHGNRVNLHLYGVHDRKVIASVLSMVAAEGMEITGGVPIAIRFFSKQKKEFTLWDEVTAKPSIIMEVNE